MAPLTVSKESMLMEAGNFVLRSSVFHELAGNFGFFACVLHVTRHSTLTQLAQKLALARKWKIVIVSAEFNSSESHEIGPRCLNN